MSEENQGFILQGLSSDLMRKSMETKHLLQKKGSLYIGTGRSDSDGLMITASLDLPMTFKEGQKFIFATNSNVDLGVEYRSTITPDFFPNDDNLVYNVTVATVPSTSGAPYESAPKAKYAISAASARPSSFSINSRLKRLGS